MKAMLREKLIALSASEKKLERPYTTSLTVHLKAQEQKEANTPKRSRWQEIIKLKVEINQVETNKQTKNYKIINKTRSWFFKKIDKIDESLVRLTRGHRDNIQINKIRNEMGDITTEIEEIFKNHQILLQKPIFNKT
jgi:ABC-type oligopeptide transport system substrate-binding subunit